MGSALDELIELLDLEQLEVNLFRGLSPDENRQRVFGGQVAAQALVAAGRTVEHGAGALAARVLPAPRRPDGPDRLRRRPHPRRPQLHDPPRRRDPARQGDLQPGGVVPRATRPAPSTRTRCPTCPTRSRCRRSASGRARTPIASRPSSRTGSMRDRPIDTRSADLPRWLDPEPGVREPEQDVWFRADGRLPDDPLLHAASSRTRPTSRCSTPRCCRTPTRGTTTGS